MSTIYSVKKGLDIKLLGDAEQAIVDLDAKQFAIKPPDFIGCFPKMLIKEGEMVQAGTPYSSTNIKKISHTPPLLAGSLWR